MFLWGQKRPQDLLLRLKCHVKMSVHPILAKAIHQVKPDFIRALVLTRINIPTSQIPRVGLFVVDHLIY